MHILTSMMCRVLHTSRNANLFLTAAKSFLGSFAAAFSNLKPTNLIKHTGYHMSIMQKNLGD